MISSLWVKVGAGVAAVLLGAYLVNAMQERAYQSGRNEVLAQWTDANLLAEKAVREREGLWQARVDDAGRERDAKVREIENAAARVADGNSRLHSAAIKAERNACQVATGAARREGAGSVLTDVLNRVGERTGRLARYADELRAALNECRGSWPQ